VDSPESEALLLENNLIKSLTPSITYCSEMTKIPIYHDYGTSLPQIRFYRGSFVKPHQYFGPFPNAWAVRRNHPALAKSIVLVRYVRTPFRKSLASMLTAEIKRLLSRFVLV